MHKFFLSTAMAAGLVAMPAGAQDITNASGSNANSTSGSNSGAAANNAGIGSSTSGSTSGSDAISGSQSGAASNQTQGQLQSANNAGIGNSDARSTSGANANSSTASTANSNGNMQGQSATNSQGQGQTATNNQSQGANNSQSQGQTANNGQTQTQGQMATNSQGTTVSNTFNSTPLKRQYIGTNTAVPLAASSSFSSDYCGGTASGGASVAPIGVSIGASAPVFDNSCRYLRLSEKAGMIAANYHNMGYFDMEGRAMSLMVWSACMAGPQQDKKHRGSVDNHVMEACLALGLLGGEGGASPPAPPVKPAPPVVEQPPVSPLYTQKPNVEPLPNDSTPYLAPKTPRGDNDKTTTTIPAKPVATTADSSVPASATIH